MRNKLLLLLVFFAAPFFFLTSNAKAISYKDITLTDEKLSQINDDFYIIRNNIINYAKEKGYYYMYHSTYVQFSNISEYHGASWGEIPVVETCDIVNNNLTNCETLSDYIYSVSPTTLYLDLNINIYFSSFSYTYHYNTYSYTYGVDNPLPSIYSLYNGINDNAGLKNEQLLTLNNFYSIVIEKINYLSKVIISNYIYLSIITIFILVFILKLIFRR